VAPVAGPAAAAAGTANTAVQPGAVQPEAVKPGAVKARPTQKKEASSRTINPGDKVCGQCGEGNDPARKFCRRCGASLVEAVIFSLPWYTRWWRKLTQRKQRVAGDRPQQRRRAIGGSGPGWLTSWVTRIILLAVLVVVVLAFVGPFSHSIKHRTTTWYHDVVNVVHPTYNQVHPIAASATSSVAGHPASNLIDGASNTSWQDAKAGAGQFAILRFSRVADLAKIGFLNGDQDSPAAYVSEPRPQTIEVIFGGKYRATKTITLKDTSAFQTFAIKTKATTGVTIVIQSVYPSSAGGNNVSMAEVELFSKSG
jgi:ribosomal protein L40E